jgi:Uma2 family endonuclease
MNIAFSRPHDFVLTQAAEGLPRRGWTVADIEKMVRVGLIGGKERFELIGGEIVPMAAKGIHHEVLKIELARFLLRAAPDHLAIAPETTLRLDPRNFLEPDFCIFERSLPLKKLGGSNLLLAIEVADTSLAYDLGRKIGIYAAFGVREVWVIDARKLVTTVHRHLGANGYADIVEHGPRKRLVPMLAAELAVRFADLPITAARKGS